MELEINIKAPPTLGESLSRPGGRFGERQIRKEVSVWVKTILL